MFSCSWFEEPDSIDPGFKDVERLSIYDILTDSADIFSSFIAILEEGGIDRILTAYNPYETGYTLFAPDNEAVSRFVDENEQFSSLNDLLSDTAYCAVLSRFHVVNKEIRSDEFPFGAFPEPTLSEDYLTVSFIIEGDSSYYKINNQASVVRTDMEASNGYVHIVNDVLKPVVNTTYDWLEENQDYSIFKGAVDLTGTRSVIDINMKDPENEFLQVRTLLVEPDEVFHEAGIQSVEDLAAFISPEDTDYSDVSNPLYNFVLYHILSGRFFVDDFEGVATNYTTFSEIPLNIDGTGVDILVNNRKQVFDTIIAGADTTYIDYVGIDYDASNVLTQSGAIHIIDQLMEQQTPTRATKYFQFYEEPAIVAYHREGGTHVIEDTSALIYIDWTGPDLSYVDLDTWESSATNADYLEINGDFTISYVIPKIVQGKYAVFLKAEAYSSANALVEVYIDGKKVGRIVNLTSGGSASRPFITIELGSVNFSKYTEHVVEVKSPIPGRFLWDYIRFTPI